MERVMRIELTTSAWKAEVLPLNYTRIILAGVVGIEPTPKVLETFVLPLNYTPINIFKRRKNLIFKKLKKTWWRMTGSNRRPSACKADALPAELILHLVENIILISPPEIHTILIYV
jgi:hypothetical protein